MRKRLGYYLTLVLFVMCACKSNENVLLSEKWNTPFETPPFSKIKVEDFKEAIPILIDRAKIEIDSIVNLDETPSFENTIEALENVGSSLNRTLGVFYNLLLTNASDSLQAVAEEVSPLITAYSNDITLNDNLFIRVKAVYDYYHSDSVDINGSLDSEQRMLLDETYKSFVRSGALLSAEDKETKRSLSEKLSLLSLKFGENSRKSTNDFSILVKDSLDVSGIPSWGLNMASEDAKASGDESGWRFTLQAPSYLSVTKYADNRNLRETMWKEYNSIALKNDEFDNQQVVVDIVNNRLSFAKLFGYNNYAEYVLTDRMAKSVERVDSFLDQLLDASYQQAKMEVKKISEFANSKGFWEELQPWDFSYWAEKYRQTYYSLDDEMTRPYFKLENVEKALFLLANKLYGLSFKENREIETCDKDARAYEVLNAEGNLQAILYLDYFPRASKKSGAWMNNFREACYDKNGKEVRPIITLVCNFTKPTENEPSLLSFDEVTTILHEFGHGLHGMLAKGKYASITGTNVNHDFVELPSQIMENWAYEKEFLDLWAVHYKTNEKIPQELVDKIIAAKNFNSAYANVRQLMFGKLDMAWHTITSQNQDVDVLEFEKNAIECTSLLPSIPGTGRSTSFNHIFSGGYAAGYYSYKWAEMLEADAFNVFKQNGIFDTNTAARFRHLLESGGSVDAMELFVEFVGHEPSVGPLLEKLGIKDNK